MKPDARKYDSRPANMAKLVKATGLTQKEIGKRIGVDERTIRRWIAGDRQFSYRDQFTIKCLAECD